MTQFIEIVTLLWWSGTEATISPRDVDVRRCEEMGKRLGLTALTGVDVVSHLRDFLGLH